MRPVKRQRKKGVLTPMTVLTDGLLLFLSLAAVAFCVLTAYSLEVDRRAVLIGCGVLTLLWLTLLSLPRFKFPLSLLVFGLWCWGLWKLWEPMNWGSAAIRCGVVNTVAKKIPGVSPIEPVAQLSPEVWPLLTTLWLLMVGVVYALALCLCLIRLRRALPTVLLTLLPILPALCVTEAPAALPMAALAVVWLTLLLTSATEAQDSAGTARLRLPALGLTCVGLFALLNIVPVAEGPCQPDWAAQMRADAFNAVNRMDLSALLSRFEFLGWKGSGSTQYVSLTGGGASRTGRVALRVHTEAQGKHYLRGYSADVYTGSRWEPLGRDARRELADILALEETSPLLSLGEAAAHLASYHPFYSSIYRPPETLQPAYETMTVENVGAPGGCAYYPYALTELPEAGASFGDDSHLRREGQTWEHTYQFLPEWEEAYVWGFYSDPANNWTNGGEDHGFPEEEPARGPTYQDFVYDHYLQVPEDTRQMLLDWLEGVDTENYLMGIRSPEDYAKLLKWQERQWVETEDGHYLYTGTIGKHGDVPWRQEEVTTEEVARCRTQYVMVVQDILSLFLQNHTHYDMDTPAPPVGEDYVNWFLNESQQGYCMHYATAGTLLLRTMGVPARYVSGYVVDVPRSGDAVVPDSAAHAWVEIYYDGVGWYPVDFTPGFQWDGTGTLSPSDFLPEDASPEVTPTPTPPPAVSAAPTPSALPSAAPSAPPKEETTAPTAAAKGRLPLWPFVTVGLLALALLSRWGLLERRRRRLRQADTNAAVLWAWRCHRQLRPWGGEENEVFTALAQRARFSQHILTEKERGTALALLSQEKRRVYEALPKWKKPLFRLWWGRG